MKTKKLLYFYILFLSLLSIGSAISCQAKTNKTQWTPYVGQEGRDVIWVPTPQPLVNKMLALAKVTPQDYVIDLGSGDGRLVITAARMGARALGIEYNPDMVALSQRLAHKEGVGDRARFVRANIFESDFSAATVITLFLLTDLNLKLRPQILELKPGTRIVSNTFGMGEWGADESVELTREDGCYGYCRAYLWIVPAKAGGTWKLPQGELTLAQDFQMLKGTLKTPAGAQPVSEGRIQGERISFTVGKTRYTGIVSGNKMSGTAIGPGGKEEWTAAR